MSQYVLIVVWFIAAHIISKVVQTKRYEYVLGKEEVRTTWFYAVCLFLPVLIMAATRQNVGDTHAYVTMYKAIPSSLPELISYVPTITKDKGFTFLGGLIKILLGDNTTTYFFILALIQSAALVAVYRKYSTDYFTSTFLFIISTDYISWMFNGIRQFTAVSIIFAATPLLLKKKWIPLILIILLASTIHGSAILMLPVVFIVQGKAWNKKTIAFTAACVLALAFADQFTNVLDTMLSETQYTNVVSEWKGMNDDGTNIVRVLVYSMPAILSFCGRKWLREDDPVIDVCTNMSIVSAAIYLVSAGTSGVFMGRLPIFTSLYGYILLPYLIERIFTERSVRLMKLIMIVAYLAFYYYQMHIAWSLI